MNRRTFFKILPTGAAAAYAAITKPAPIPSLTPEAFSQALLSVKHGGPACAGADFIRAKMREQSFMRQIMQSALHDIQAEEDRRFLEKVTKTV